MDFLTNYSKVPEFTECNVAILVTGIVIGVITSLLFFGNNRVNNKIDMDSEKVYFPLYFYNDLFAHAEKKIK